MKICPGHVARERDICELFTATFSASEGSDEGAVIGALVQDLMKTTPDRDLFVWSAYEDEELSGCVFFSRLAFARDNRTAFILSPVAVRTDRQRSGIGRRLISHGLNQLRREGVDFVTTYGDPDYYSKVGFAQISEDFARAPLPLSYPKAWLGQSLAGEDRRPFIGASSCVPALNKPELW